MRARRSFGGFLRVVALVALVAAGIWFLSERVRSSDTATPPATALPIETPGPAAAQETPVGVGEQDSIGEDTNPPTIFEVPPDARRAEVRWIHDGDSFDVRFLDPAPTDDVDSEAETSDSGFDEIRLQGIDTPEPGACFAEEARDRLIDKLKGTEVMVHADWDGGRFSDGRDQYFRLIADVWLNGRLVNFDQVADGYALARSSGSSFDAAIRDAQMVAQAMGAGLWSPSACGLPQSAGQLDAATLAIASINADAAGRDDENPNGEWVDIENTSSDAVDLTGWTLRDESTRNRFGFPAGTTLVPGATVRVRTGCGNDTATELYWCAETPVWTNAADTAYLVQPDGRFHAVLSYSE